MNSFHKAFTLIILFFTCIFLFSCVTTQEQVAVEPEPLAIEDVEAIFDLSSLEYNELVIESPVWEVETKDWDKILPPEFREPDSAEISINETVMGYRVQVEATQNYVQAIELHNRLIIEFDEKVYLVFDAPLYKIRIGDCVSRSEAEILQNLAVRRGHSGAWVIPENIFRYAEMRRDSTQNAVSDSIFITPDSLR